MPEFNILVDRDAKKVLGVSIDKPTNADRRSVTPLIFPDIREIASPSSEVDYVFEVVVTIPDRFGPEEERSGLFRDLKAALKYALYLAPWGHIHKIQIVVYKLKDNDLSSQDWERIADELNPEELSSLGL